MLRFVRFALLALPVASEVSLDSALKEDDCGDGECVLNAIQLKGLKKEQSVGEDLYEELQEGDESWLKDINSKTKNHFKHIWAPLQKPIVTNYQYLAELEKFVNYTMMKIENATGRAVIWNRKSLLQEDEDEESDEVSDEELQSSYGRRRRSIKGEDLPPRARYINKILIYLNKEMEAVWNYNTIVDRKRWGVGNTITSSPYGPHGEHPKRWRANVTVPFPTHELQEGDESWLKDINSKTKNHFKHILAPLQKPIVTNYQYLAELEKFVNYTMMKIENATGRAVIWNRKSLLQEDEDEESDEVSDEELQSSYGRRRRSIKGEDLPPRARYINKILIYLNKEMEAVWNYNTIVDRKRWGVGNTITSSPYGPHGEHPKRWRANVTVPFPTHAPVSPVLNVNNSLTMHMKAEDRKYDNKYAMQLQADYQSLIDNINDASKKCNDLRKRLYKMDAYADKFIKLPSGVWNKIDAQS